MDTVKRGSKLVYWVASVFVFWGAIATAADLVSQFEFAFPLDLGISIGNGAIAAAGLMGLAVAKSLRCLEERLDRLHQALNTGRPTADSVDKVNPR